MTYLSNIICWSMTCYQIFFNKLIEERGIRKLIMPRSWIMNIWHNNLKSFIDKYFLNERKESVIMRNSIVYLKRAYHEESRIRSWFHEKNWRAMASNFISKMSINVHHSEISANIYHNKIKIEYFFKIHLFFFFALHYWIEGKWSQNLILPSVNPFSLLTDVAKISEILQFRQSRDQAIWRCPCFT